MIILDYFFNEYLVPLVEGIKKSGEIVLSWFLWIVLFITTPIWVIPYLFIKNKSSKKDK